MKKHIVLSVNSNPEYLYYLPLTIWAWRKFGWEPIVMSADQDGRFTNLICDYVAISNKEMLSNYIFKIDPHPDYGTDTLAQVSRLYAACVADGYIMTGDVDMIPLSDYWKPDMDKITTWGHDLTGYEHFPICYIGMPSTRWTEVMGLTSNRYNDLMIRDLNTLPQAAWSADPIKRWCVDQDLITERLHSVQFPKTHVLRGVYKNGYPVGRVDRSAWTLEHDKLIDCHMYRGIWKTDHKLAETMDLLHKAFPGENFRWFIEYDHEFKKLAQ